MAKVDVKKLAALIDTRIDEKVADALKKKGKGKKKEKGFLDSLAEFFGDDEEEEDGDDDSEEDS